MKAIVICLLFFCTIANSQTYKGQVVDQKTMEPIVSASVYFSGTSLGTYTDLNGRFELNKTNQLDAPLVIKTLGYEKKIIEKPKPDNFLVVKLTVTVGQLDAVYLNPDPWSRKKKEDYFKKYFLGETKYSKTASIVNLDKVFLRFNPVTSQLTASCAEPIIVINKRLGYQISYDLGVFELNFLKIEGSIIGGKIVDDGNVEYRPQSSYVETTSFYKDLLLKKSKLSRAKKRRQQLYLVSELRLLRSLKNNTFELEGYQLFHRGFIVKSKNHIRVRKIKNLYRLDFRHNKYSIMDPKKNQTDIVLNQNSVLINEFGILLSLRSVSYSGFLGRLRTGGQLPLDFSPDQGNQ